MNRGDCFQTAFDIVDRAHDDTLTLVHGIVDHPETGRHWHAWVEQARPCPTIPDDMFPPGHVEMFKARDWSVCIDKANGNDMTMPRDVYYAFGRVEVMATYTATEARRAAVGAEHYGPWVPGAEELP